MKIMSKFLLILLSGSLATTTGLTTVSARKRTGRPTQSAKVLKKYGNFSNLSRSDREKIHFVFQINDKHIKTVRGWHLIGTDLKVTNRSAKTVTFNLNRFYAGSEKVYGKNRLIKIKARRSVKLRNVLTGTEAAYTIPVEEMASQPYRGPVRFIYAGYAKHHNVYLESIDSMFIKSQRGTRSKGLVFHRIHGRIVLKYVQRKF